MAPPIIMTPLNDFLGTKDNPKAGLNWVEQLASTLKLWYLQFTQWSASCRQILFSNITAVNSTAISTTVTFQTIKIPASVLNNCTALIFKYIYNVTINGGTSNINLVLNGTTISSFAVPAGVAVNCSGESYLFFTQGIAKLITLTGVRSDNNIVTGATAISINPGTVPTFTLTMGMPTGPNNVTQQFITVEAI